MERTRMQRFSPWLLVPVALAVAAVAAAATWVQLGERIVKDRVDHDTIVVTGVAGQFTALKIHVLRRPVHFLDLKIHYANGGVQDVSLRSVIPAGGETRVIDLEGDDRVIRRVELWYEAESIGRGKRAAIRLFGRR